MSNYNSMGPVIGSRDLGGFFCKDAYSENDDSDYPDVTRILMAHGRHNLESGTGVLDILSEYVLIFQM